MHSALLLLACATTFATTPGTTPAPTRAPTPASTLGAPALAAPLRTDDEAPPRLRPEPLSLADAQARASERNLPLLVICCVEGEPQNDEFRDAAWVDAKLVAAARDVLVLAGNDGVHEKRQVVEETEGGAVTREVCKHYDTPTCTDHQQVMDDVYVAFAEEGVLATPAVYVLLPDGTRAWGQADGHVPEMKDVLGALEKAKRRAGPPLSAEAFGRIQVLRQEAQRHAAAGEWPQAWGKWEAVLALQEQGRWAEEARAGEAAAEVGAQALRQAALERLVPGTAAQAWSDLRALADALPDTELAKEIERDLRKAERDDAIEDELRLHKLDLEAAALLAEAREAYKRGDERQGDKLVIRVFRSKYEGTKTQEETKRQYPALWEELQKRRSGDGE